MHCITHIPSETVGIFDLSASAPLARQFVSNGNNIIFTSSLHPFSQYVANFSPLPYLEVGGGTVAIAAVNVALSLGFKGIECRGLDFAYTAGKAYTKGVYLSAEHQKNVTRMKTEETFFASIIFSRGTTQFKENNKITYRTKILDSYKEAFDKMFYSSNHNIKKWENKDFLQFPYELFIKKLKKDMNTFDNDIKYLFLPFLAWRKMQKQASNLEKSDAFEPLTLVLKKILMI